MDLLVDYYMNDKALSIADQKVVLCGQNYMQQSTDGCQIYVQWKDGSISCQYLKYLK